MLNQQQCAPEQYARDLQHLSTVTGVDVPDEIFCVECQGTCYRLTQRPDDDPFLPGDFVAYRCPDCAERFDMVLAEDEDD